MNLCLERTLPLFKDGHVTEPFWSHCKAHSPPNAHKCQLESLQVNPKVRKSSCKSWNVSVQCLQNGGRVLAD